MYKVLIILEFAYVGYFLKTRMFVTVTHSLRKQLFGSRELEFESWLCHSFLAIKLGKLPWWLSWWKVCLKCGRPGFDPCAGKVPWSRAWQPTPVFLPGESRGQRSLVGYSPWSHTESDMTEVIAHMWYSRCCSKSYKKYNMLRSWLTMFPAWWKMSNKHYTELCPSVFVFGLKESHSFLQKWLSQIAEIYPFKALNAFSVLLFHMEIFWNIVHIFNICWPDCSQHGLTISRWLRTWRMEILYWI